MIKIQLIISILINIITLKNNKNKIIRYLNILNIQIEIKVKKYQNKIVKYIKWNIMQIVFTNILIKN